MSKINNLLVSIVFISFLIACGSGGSKVPLPPVATPDIGSTTLKQSIVVDVLANDSDPEGSALTISSIGQPSSGTAQIVNNQIEFQPGSQSGTFTFSYTISNESSLSSTANVSVEVSPISLVLKGRLSSEELDKDVFADIETSSGSVTFQAKTANNGLFDLSIDISDLSGFITLRGDGPDGQIEYQSLLGSAEKIIDQLAPNNELEFSDYLQLELSPYSTALYATLNLNKSTELLFSDELIENLLKEHAGDSVFQLAIAIKRLLNNEIAFPEGATNFTELFSDKAILYPFLRSFSDDELIESSNLLLNELSFYSAEDSYSSDLTFLTSREVTDFSTFFVPLAIQKAENGNIQLSSTISLTERNGVRLNNKQFNNEFSILIEDNGSMSLNSTKLDPMDDVFSDETFFVNGCSESKVLVTLSKVEVFPVYRGTITDQFLVRFSGLNHPGENFESTCGSATSVEWSYVGLFSSTKNNVNLTEKLNVGVIAARVGLNTDFNSLLPSPSMIDLESDGSAFVSVDQSNANWEFLSNGNFLLRLADRSSIEFYGVEEFGLSTRYAARKSYLDGTQAVYSGLIMNAENNVVFDDVVGRYELLRSFEEEPFFALAFFNDNTGNQESRELDGWTPTQGIFTYQWNLNNSMDELSLDYYTSRDENGNWISRTDSGCGEEELDCYLWRHRDIKLLAVDSEYVYVSMNIMTDNARHGLDQIETWGYVGIYRKTEFYFPQ